MTVRVGDIVAHTRKRGWLKAEERFAGVVSRVSSGGHKVDVDRPAGEGSLVVRVTLAVSSLHAPTDDEKASIRAWQDRMAKQAAMAQSSPASPADPPPSSIDWEQVYVDLWLATATSFIGAHPLNHAEYVEASIRVLRQRSGAMR